MVSICSLSLPNTFLPNSLPSQTLHNTNLLLLLLSSSSFIHETFIECCSAPHGKYGTPGRGERGLREDLGHWICRFIEELAGRSRVVGFRVQQPFPTLCPSFPGVCKGRDSSPRPRMSHCRSEAALVIPSLSVRVSGLSSGQGDLRASLLGALDP